jgi:hypothetical protein
MGHEKFDAYFSLVPHTGVASGARVAVGVVDWTQASKHAALSLSQFCAAEHVLHASRFKLNAHPKHFLLHTA